jgi:His/Glu/Gln/Arg/opine family amino acid ABC transporter permease subunit
MTLLASFDWGVIWENRIALLHGLQRTIEVSAIGIVGATVIGIVLGAIRANRVPVLSQLAATYVEVIRNTPILVQIFMLFYGLPALSSKPVDLYLFHLDLRFSPFTTAWLAVMIWGGAFNTENFRAGFEAVPWRYREAGLALGFSRLATFRRVTLPIGGRISLPSTINTHVSVLKNTSLMTAIGFQELTTSSRSISASNFKDVEMLSTVAVVYLVLVWSLSGFVRLLERRLAYTGVK